jgi:hypothetical protein
MTNSDTAPPANQTPATEAHTPGDPVDGLKTRVPDPCRGRGDRP